jgi:hypothetical protein
MLSCSLRAGSAARWPIFHLCAYDGDLLPPDLSSPDPETGKRTVCRDSRSRATTRVSRLQTVSTGSEGGFGGVGLDGGVVTSSAADDRRGSAGRSVD